MDTAGHWRSSLYRWSMYTTGTGHQPHWWWRSELNLSQWSQYWISTMECLVFPSSDKGLSIRPGVSSLPSRRWTSITSLFTGTFVVDACKKRYNIYCQTLSITKRTKDHCGRHPTHFENLSWSGYPTNSLLNSFSPADATHHFGQWQWNERNLLHCFTVEQREAHSQVLHDISFLWSELNPCIY